VIEPIPDPIGLPVPVAVLLVLKVFGFFLHMVFMNLWLAGLPVALVLIKRQPAVASRLFTAMPFFMAFGINAGIVPLLFIQTLYPQFFYPATILQAWFWFVVIPLLVIAYYGVYLAAFDRFRLAAGLVASLLLAWIGLTFSAALSLTATPERWPSIFLATADAGSVHGIYLHLKEEALLRYLLMLGMAFGTVAVFLVMDAEWFSADPGYRTRVSRLSLIVYGLGSGIYAAGGSLYAPMVAGKLSPIWWYLAGFSMPVGLVLAAAYGRWPGRRTASALFFAHLFVLLSNAIARQMVQFGDLQKWMDPEKSFVRGEWGSFYLFVVASLVVLGALAWIARVALRCMRSPA